MNTIMIILIVLSVLVTLSTVIIVAVAVRAETYMKYKRQLMEEDCKKALSERIDFMELKDTIEFMQSDDYKDKFKAEYWQVADRYKKLSAMLVKWDKGELNFTPTCPRSTYNMQLKAMTDYMAVLEIRAVAEGIEL